MSHGESVPNFKRHVLILRPGGEADIPAPCCTWAKFAIVSLVRFRVGSAPAIGDLTTWRLLRDPITNELVPGETKSVPVATVAADFAAGVESRDQRFMEGGAAGLRLRNTLDATIIECIVEWREYTLHNIPR